MNPTENTENSDHTTNRPRLVRRIGAICLVVIITTVGLFYWQERSLYEAEAAFENGDAEYANFLIDKHLEKHPDSQQAIALKARILVFLGQPDEAIRLFDQVGAATVDDTHAWARALMLKGQWSHAIPLLRRVLDSRPDDPDALYETAACQVRVGQFTDALTHATRLTEVAGHAARGFVFVGTIQGDLGNHAAAASAFAEVLKLEPDAENLQVTPDEFYLQQGHTFLRLGKPEASLEPLKISVAIRETPEALVFLGNAAALLDRPDNAIQAWKRAVAIAPGNEDAREGLANMALQNGHGAEALEWLGPLEESDTLTASTAFMFQRAHMLMNDEDATRRWKETADKLRRVEEIKADINTLVINSPNSFWARVARAHQYADDGNWEEAETLLQRILKEAPGDTFVIELADAVFRREELPPIEQIPIEHF